MRHALLLAASILNAAPSQAIAGIVTEKPSLNEIRQLADDWRQRLVSLSVEYDGVTEGVDTHSLQIRFAAKGEKRYMLRRKRLPDGTGFDPFAFESFYDRGMWNLHDFSVAKYETRAKAGDDETTKIRAHVFAEALAWWPPDDLSEPPHPYGNVLFAHQLLADDSCRVTSTEAEVEGVRCAIVEVPGCARLWIDIRVGALRQHERLDKDGNVICRFELRDYREVQPDVWFPHRIIRRVMSPESVSTYFVRRVGVNDVPDSFFTYVPEPGTLIVNRDTDIVTQVPGGLNVLFRLAEDVASIPAVSNQRRGIHPPVFGMRHAMIAGGVFTLLGVMWFAGMVRR